MHKVQENVNEALRQQEEKLMISKERKKDRQKDRKKERKKERKKWQWRQR